MKRAHLLLIIISTTLIFYAPILYQPALILNRGNDLQEQFWPVFYFIKTQFWQTHTLPFWNNLFLSGLPLLPDPQFSLFYPPNLLFLLLPTGTAFIASFLLHTLLAGIGAYLVAKLALNLSPKASLFAACLYLATPKLAAYLEAGHYGLVASLTWLPFALLATLMLAKAPKLSWSILLAASLAGLFYTHSVTFLLAIAASTTTLTISLILTRPERFLSSLLYFALGLITTFGLSAITLLPQLAWAPQTTRFLLLAHPDVYPKWTSLAEFFQNLFPLTAGFTYIASIDTEKWLALGTITSFLAVFGFTKLKTSLKIIFTLSALTITIITLNNFSPFYSTLITQNWYILMRVTTRIWFVPTLAIPLLAALGFNALLKTKIPKNLLHAFAVICFAELLFLSWSHLKKPPPDSSRFAPTQIYDFLRQDQGHFRVFCLNRCLSQQKSAQNNLELIEGYNTLQQINYYKEAWQFTNSFWDYYTLATPPIGLYQTSQIQPDPVSLGAYNTKYIISPYPLADKNLKLVKTINTYRIYENPLVSPRAYFKTTNNPEAKILYYSPNHIRVDTSSHASNQLILAEVYNPDWKAYLNGTEAVPVQQTPIALRHVDIKPNTQFVDFKYDPDSYYIGHTITIVTLIFLAALAFLNQKASKLPLIRKLRLKLNYSRLLHFFR